jgi:hypothetical protein
MTERWCKVCRGWHDLDQPWPAECDTRDYSGRGSVPMPMVISDTMPETECLVDGRIYTSKRAMAATHRRSGHVELGTEAYPVRKARQRPPRAEIKASLEKAEARFNRGERVSREIAKGI